MTEPAPDGARADRFRWIARAVAAAIGLWFLADGLRGMWSGAGVLARVLIVVAVVLGVVAAGVAALRVVRRDRSG